RGRAACDPESFLAAAEAVGRTEVANLHAVDRQRQRTFGRRKGDRRTQSPGILQGTESGANLLALLRARGGGRGGGRAGGESHILLELGNQIFETVGLPCECDRALPFRLQCLLGLGLLFLSLFDQERHALALLR